MIWTLTGPTGAGKTTLLHNLMLALPGARPLLSYTTREERPTDLEGEYLYINEATYEEMLAAEEFLKPAGVRGKRYGTRKEDIAHALESGLYFPILVPDVLKELYEFAILGGHQRDLRSIYLRVEDFEELRRRLRERGDSEENIALSLASCKDYNAIIPTMGIRFLVIDALMTPEAICERALAAITAPDKHKSF